MTRLRPIVFLILVFALQCLQIASAKAQSGEPPDNSPDDTGLWLAIFGRGDISIVRTVQVVVRRTHASFRR